MKNAVIVPIHKKDSRMECTIYNTEEYVSVISTVEKMFARVLNERVKAQTEDKVMDEQGGFRA